MNFTLQFGEFVAPESSKILDFFVWVGATIVTTAITYVFFRSQILSDSISADESLKEETKQKIAYFNSLLLSSRMEAKTQLIYLKKSLRFSERNHHRTVAVFGFSAVSSTGKLSNLTNEHDYYHMFREVYGNPPHIDRKFRRLIEAADFLINKRLSLIEIIEKANNRDLGIRTAYLNSVFQLLEEVTMATNILNTSDPLCQVFTTVMANCQAEMNLRTEEADAEFYSQHFITPLHTQLRAPALVRTSQVLSYAFKTNKLTAEYEGVLEGCERAYSEMKRGVEHFQRAYQNLAGEAFGFQGQIGNFVHTGRQRNKLDQFIIRRLRFLIAK